MLSPESLFVHLVTYNHRDVVCECLRALGEQEAFTLGENLILVVRDNGSTDGTYEQLLRESNGPLLRQNKANLGFCAAHNQGVTEFLDCNAKYMLAINPDVVLGSSALYELMLALAGDDRVGSAVPKLLRADGRLRPVEPRRFDSAGMFINPALRHFDRGSEEVDQGQYEESRYVFGGTGACLMMKRGFIEEALLDSRGFSADLEAIYPQLFGAEERAQLFDEAFFAYREDADLAWRGQMLGWKCLYVPLAVGYHRRVVLPERRRALAPELNLYGVRNRFLLQLNNFSWRAVPAAILPGVIWRNLLVVLGVLLGERTSLPGLLHVLRLRRRAHARRAEIVRRVAHGNSARVGRWFQWAPYTEEIERK